ncbi:YfbU family protein [Corynebacterium doosanense]|uniref:YfbU family protein n=1 Tax=Corynebacterium doosanense CAU 212 = DSM 45436 TaxID=558173 RepID=A0A097IJS8_9CORY|nr:YfbU family protein [Corynebacterium doosanense]AIT62365.1 hypothetical protein CDOO_13325 [Corynebacterium doosanense CAU 212 = DSM 45436]
MKAITVRLPDDLRELLGYAAASRHQTQSDYLRGVIEAHLDQTHIGRPPRDNTGDITLTLVERQTLALAHLTLLASMGDLPPDRYDKDNSLRAVEVLERGYAGEYPQLFPQEEEGLSYHESKIVWDILDMFRVISSSVSHLGEGGWDQIPVLNAQHLGTFQGFDYQIDVEGKMAEYVDYLVRTSRWAEQQQAVDHGLNSHSQMLPTYLSMLAVFKPLWRNKVSHGTSRLTLSAKELADILLAAPGAERTGKKL